MIYPELRHYLTLASSPETVRTFDNAVDVMDKYGLQGYMDMFDEVVGADPNTNDAGVVDALQLNLRTALTHLLAIQGLKVHEYVLTSQMVQVLDALYMLPDYEDQTQVSGIMDADFTEMEAAAELLALLMVESPDELLGYFEEVEPSFVESLRLRMDLRSGDEVPLDNDIYKYIKAYQGYRGVVGVPVFSDFIMNEPAAIGLPFARYVEMYQAHDGAKERSIDEIAKDLVGMAYLSQDGVEAPLIVVRQHLNNLFGDINQVTKINIAVSKLTVEVTNAQA